VQDLQRSGFGRSQRLSFRSPTAFLSLRGPSPAQLVEQAPHEGTPIRAMLSDVRRSRPARRGLAGPTPGSPGGSPPSPPPGSLPLEVELLLVARRRAPWLAVLPRVRTWGRTRARAGPTLARDRSRLCSRSRRAAATAAALMVAGCARWSSTSRG